MSSSRMGTNGASLEDCHTNVFALTELNGLKWKCVTTPQSHRGWTSIDQDPVLSAYAKCLQAGILCAWRRQPSQVHNPLTQIPLPDYRIDVIKELWVFWYSPDEPELLAQYTNELTCGENGRGNWANPGIQYEIRTLYFKALHNLIERSLMKSGYVRIGRYFVRPYDMPSSDRLQCLPSYILGISFNFFVHGENIVCTYVNVQKQPAIFRLSPAHLELQKKQAVILGPWSLRAYLIPGQSDAFNVSTTKQPSAAPAQSFPKMSPSTRPDVFGETSLDSQQSTSQASFSYDAPSGMQQDTAESRIEKLWNDWELFFGLSTELKSSESGLQKSRQSTSASDEAGTTSKRLPKMVLVDVDGVRMWFPSSLIVLQAADDLLLKTIESESSGEEMEKLNETLDTEKFEEVPTELGNQLPKGAMGSSALSSGCVSPSLLRKKRRKRRKCEIQEPDGQHRNLMYSSMVNGSRAAQRYFEEACILPPLSRRRESVDSLSSVLGSKPDDDAKWNLTDGIRGSECDTEHHLCRPCHLENSARTPIPSTSGISHYGTPQSSRGSPCSKMFCSGGSDGASGIPSKGAKIPFHQRSPANARSPSPSRSPVLERKYARFNMGHSSDIDRGSPDWIHDNSSHGSSMGSIKGRSDSFDDIAQSPESPLSCSSDSPVYRRIYYPPALAPKHSGQQSPVEERQTGKSLSSCFLPDTSVNTAATARVIMPSNSFGTDKKCGESTDSSAELLESEVKYFASKKKTKKNRLLQKRKIECDSIVPAFDMLFVTTGRREDWKSDEFSEREVSCQDLAASEACQNELNRTLEKRASDECGIREAGLSKETIFDSSGLSSRAFGNAVYDSDIDAHTSYLDSCSPSTVAMMDTESLAEPVADSVHLSPPASNERVEPMSISSTLSGPVANNLLARVGGPPSVGDYMIYPTPPSVDPVQSQQFSPQNVIMHSSVNNGFYSSSAAPYMAINQCFANANLCQLQPSQTLHCAEPYHENVVALKSEFDDESFFGLQGKFANFSKDRLPLFGKTVVLRIVLCGKYGGDVFKEENVLTKGVYFDQRKQFASSILLRAKRKRIFPTPSYQPIRDEQRIPDQKVPSFERSRPHLGTVSLTSSLPSISAVMGQTSTHSLVGMGPNSSSGSVTGPMHGMVSSPVGSLSQSMPMGQIRPARPHSLAYAASPSGIGQHNPGFLSPTYGASPSLIGPSSQMSGMHGSPMGVTPQGMNMMPGQSPSMMSATPGHAGMNMMPTNMSNQPPQPFQQLSQFVNSANFPNQQTPLFNQQQFFQQQAVPRSGMQGNVTPQHPVQSPSSFGMDSQASTPIEPPPSFSQAMSSQFSTNTTVTSTAPSVYGQSPQMMRSGSFIGSANSPIMLSGSRPLQGSATGPPSSTNSSLGSSMFNPRPGVSQNPEMTGPMPQNLPEGNSLALAVLLQDTVLDLHYDSAFDACPICSCNGNIRTKELGLYITPPEVLRQPSSQQQPIVSKPTSGFFNSGTSNTCTCGFSAVRHRYLSMKAGLFPEDAKEATDITDGQTQPVIPHTIWFDPISKKDIDFIALLCEQTLVRDLGGFVDKVALFSMQCERAVQFERIGSDSCKKTEYIISDVDQRELPLVFQAACEVACMEMNCRRPRHDLQSVLWHNWGVQVANEMFEPRESECLAVLNEIGPVLEETLRKARSAPMGGSNNIVEGPLTWRHFDRKSLKTGSVMEDDSLPEPIPNILLASEKDAINISPQALRMWEKMSLEPYDQPKDVLYVAVVPDNSVCLDKSKKYFEDLSRIYEQCRFGKHLPFAKEVLKDGFLRVPTRMPVHSNSPKQVEFLKQVERHINNNSLIAKLSAYMLYVEYELSNIINNNSYIFSRESYRALLIENQVQAAAATPTSVSLPGASSGNGNEQMPPPAAPGSASSVHVDSGVSSLGGGSGPASVGAHPSCSVDSVTSTNLATEVSNQASSIAAAPHIPDQIAESFAKDEPGTLPHVIVLYLVNPFLTGAEESPLVARLVTVALMRAFAALLDHIDTMHRPQLQLEIVGLQAILDYTGVAADILKDECGQLNAFDQGRMEKSLNERLNSMDALKRVAFSVYSQSRILLPDVVGSILPTSMTRFGPASAMSDLLETRKNTKPALLYKVPSKPFILAPPPPVMLRPNNELMQMSTEETVLFVSYCLIGVDFLAATVTDHQGHLLDNCLINLRLKPEHKRANMRYKQSTQIRDSLYRLWSYILGTLATGTKNCRLVIGKVGRIGHGEFKFWTQLLSKSYLKQIPSRMKHACHSCHQMSGTSEIPGVLSACLVSVEPEPHLRIFPSSFQHDERFAKNARYRTLNTPDDASCTHILVFPTSPELNLDHQGGSGGQDVDVDDFTELLEGGELDNEFSEILSGEDLNLNTIGPPPPSASLRMAGNTGIPNEYVEANFENQPLAAGYYVSTAPASELPEWFWSSCPSAKRRNPVHLKSSLHLNTNNVQQGDELSFGTKGSEACHHQLDSQATVDVLRYVLETYNALSWVNVDLVTGERRSCLPVHIQALMRLCNTVDRLIN